MNTELISPRMDVQEMLARAWIDCDPNRAGAQRFSGWHPDDTNDPRPVGQMAAKLGISVASHLPSSDGEPRWKWFIPRAEALQEYIEKHGYRIVPAKSLQTKEAE